eukprot:CAMPEP_0115065872 /NCGR_PEP_ID=MMETSP0227-20121206/10496_1 /TAXON_ID=89957 /ORGANISM="Polarella glacialis, Strain CCMP 1383" /LENGTH=65 /DNA_ID=CAMNT_0002451717 /DNA_START=109 /DNA_END=303 /DNA_ORIENTATION=+
MQQQGENVTQLARATSASALFARMQARSKGTPLPFVAGNSAISMDSNGVYAGGRKIALSNKFWMM